LLLLVSAWACVILEIPGSGVAHMTNIRSLIANLLMLPRRQGNAP
jgi:hypothetical protein